MAEKAIMSMTEMTMVKGSCLFLYIQLYFTRMCSLLINSNEIQSIKQIAFYYEELFKFSLDPLA